VSPRPIGAGVGAAVRAASDRLTAAGVASPRHDAEALAAHVLGARRPGLVLAAFDGGSLRRYDALVARRAAREPLQHLTGVAPFRHLELAVGPGVFIPRPETEGLVELVLAAAGPDRIVVDLCAGSGAVAVAVATERLGTEVHAVEADPAALLWLRRNAGELVQVHAGRAAEALPQLAGAVDVVVSNPPYLPTGLALEPEVADHDPALALWGGADGLEVIVEVVGAAVRLLCAGGLLALEHDASHQRAVAHLLRESGFEAVTGHVDLSGRDRYVTGVRMAP
jgi:release factor glutamine methyltransferase